MPWVTKPSRLTMLTARFVWVFKRAFYSRSIWEGPLIKFTVFNYYYCDASNYKAWGSLLLQGLASISDIEDLRNRLDSNEFFIAEQLGVPPLYAELWELSNGPSDDDHVWHSLYELRPAVGDETTGKVFDTVENLISKIRAVKSWNETLSPHWSS